MNKLVSDQDHLDLGVVTPVVALLAAAMGILFLYWGIRGLAAYGAGSQSSIADPITSSIGVVTGPWMLSIAIRLAQPGAKEHHLLTSIELLVPSIFTVVGGLWSAALSRSPKALLMPVIGLLGLAAWWSRRKDKAKSPSTAA